MQITYRVSSSIEDQDSITHATTGDGWIAYSLFYDLIEENPDRVYAIEAYTEFDGDDEADALIKETPEGIIELVAYVRGSKEEPDLDIVVFDRKPEALNEALEAMGLSIA